MTESSVQRRTVRVELENGLHLRPYSMIAKCASEYSSRVSLIVQNLTLDAKSTLELMTMGADAAAFGTEMTLEASGEDSLEAVQALQLLFENRFETDNSTAE